MVTSSSRAGFLCPFPLLNPLTVALVALLVVSEMTVVLVAAAAKDRCGNHADNHAANHPTACDLANAPTAVSTSASIACVTITTVASVASVTSNTSIKADASAIATPTAAASAAALSLQRGVHT